MILGREDCNGAWGACAGAQKAKKACAGAQKAKKACAGALD